MAALPGPFARNANDTNDKYVRLLEARIEDTEKLRAESLRATTLAGDVARLYSEVATLRKLCCDSGFKPPPQAKISDDSREAIARFDRDSESHEDPAHPSEIQSVNANTITDQLHRNSKTLSSMSPTAVSAPSPISAASPPSAPPAAESHVKQHRSELLHSYANVEIVEELQPWTVIVQRFFEESVLFPSATAAKKSLQLTEEQFKILDQWTFKFLMFHRGKSEARKFIVNINIDGKSCECCGIPSNLIDEYTDAARTKILELTGRARPLVVKTIPLVIIDDDEDDLPNVKLSPKGLISSATASSSRQKEILKARIEQRIERQSQPVLQIPQLSNKINSNENVSTPEFAAGNVMTASETNEAPKDPCLHQPIMFPASFSELLAETFEMNDVGMQNLQFNEAHSNSQANLAPEFAGLNGVEPVDRVGTVNLKEFEAYELNSGPHLMFAPAKAKSPTKLNSGNTKTRRCSGEGEGDQDGDDDDDGHEDSDEDDDDDDDDEDYEEKGAKKKR
ncbi:hypothetical protein HDU82_005061 [Entophlyctis luteolus]|nr:hypothetical protein HDU82_005061 [Entophlyctis luteolus]